MRKAQVALLIILVGLMGTATLGEAEEKMTVSSQEQSIDYANRILTYRGEVKVTWTDYTLEADEVQVYLTPENTLEKIIATGGVKIRQDKGIRGSCERITYTAQDGVLLLEGNVNYQDEIGNTLSAQKVTIWTRERKVEARGNPVIATYILKEEVISGTPGGESK
jgi:lipopolysaccharide transport protein LptA